MGVFEWLGEPFEPDGPVQQPRALTELGMTPDTAILVTLLDNQPIDTSHMSRHQTLGI